MKLSILVIILTALSIIPAYATSPNIGIRDITVDMDKDAALAKLKDEKGMSCSEIGCMGPAFVKRRVEAVYIFGKTTGKLVMITLKFESSFYKLMLNSLVEKYGDPVSQETKILQSRMGVEIPSKTAKWQFDNGVIEISEVGEKIGSGKILMAGKSVIEEIKNQKIADKMQPGF